MNDKDAKELIKQLQRINKNLEKLTEAIEKGNCNYIYKVTPTNAPVPLDPITNPPYTFTCEDRSTTAAPPYYGTKVDTIDWTNKDSLEALN